MQARRITVSTLALLIAAYPPFAFATNCAAGDQALAANQNTSLRSQCPNGFTGAIRGSLQQSMADNPQIAQMVSASAQQQGVPVSLALAVAYQESRFNPCAGSFSGVLGPMQLTTRTASSLGYDRNMLGQNIDGGMAVLRRAVNACGTSDYACLASRYNGSSPNQQADWARGVGAADQQLQNNQALQDQACSGNSTAPTTPVRPINNQTGGECPTPEGSNSTTNPNTPVKSEADYQKYLGQSWGQNQECASLTKYFNPSLGAASTWRRGDQVQGNTNLRPGTPIATFNFGDRYGPPGSPGGSSGVSHTGIYLGQSAEGVRILDQWNGSGGARIHTIPWSDWNGNASEGGSRYYTISH
jgi:hypothetical protein